MPLGKELDRPQEGQFGAQPGLDHHVQRVAVDCLRAALQRLLDGSLDRFRVRPAASQVVRRAGTEAPELRQAAG